MSNINFRKTAKGYSADYQRNDGFGWERRYYRAADVESMARHYGWESAGQEVHGEGWTVAEMLVTHNSSLRPYRVSA